MDAVGGRKRLNSTLLQIFGECDLKIKRMVFGIHSLRSDVNEALDANKVETKV